MINKYKEKLKKHFHDVVKIKKSAHSIALGFAIGTFIGIVPTPGISVLIGVLIVLIFRKVSKLSLFSAIALWNPIITFPLHLLSYKIGNLIFGSLPVVEYNLTILDQIYRYSRRYLAGNTILATTISTASYFIVKKIVILSKKAHK